MNRIPTADASSGGDRGFSLIEMIVVVAVLGVLAAVSVPVYLGVQNSAKDVSVQSDLDNAKKAIVAFGTDHEGALPASISRSGAATFRAERVDLARYGWSAGANTTDLTYSPGLAGAWCVLGTSSTGATFAVMPGAAAHRAASCS